jgi:hypothetical protein
MSTNKFGVKMQTKSHMAKKQTMMMGDAPFAIHASMNLVIADVEES